MTGSDLKTQAESILDGETIPTDFFYQLLNIAKTKLEEQRVWQYLKKLDSSNTASSGNNYTTGFTLPTDFAQDYKLKVGLDTEYFPVSFEDQHVYRNSSHRYYLDIGGNKFYLLGNGVGGTIYFFYKRFTDDLTSSTSPVFPTRFHPILAFYVAAYYQMGVDSDDVFARMSPQNRSAAQELQNAMISWDFSLSLRSQNNQVGVANSQPEVVIGDM